MKTKEQRHQYYLRNRDKILKRVKEYKKQHRTRYNELEKQRRAENPEKYNLYARDYLRKNVIRGTNGEYIRAKKRPYPADEGCEICHKKRQLVWHHWVKAKPELGMWICRGCHFKAEDIEHGWFFLYFALKEVLIKEQA